MAKLTLDYVLTLGPNDFTEETLRLLFREGKQIDMVRFRGTKEQWLEAPVEFMDQLEQYFNDGNALLIWDSE